MVLAVVSILIIGVYLWQFGSTSKNDNQALGTVTNIKDLSFELEGKNIKLSKGVYEENIPNSSQKMIVKMFGEPVYGDISGDSIPDAIIYVVVETGGSGSFFYAVAAQGSDQGWVGSNAELLGDRIAPQNINIINGVANFNFADRNPGESFSVRPSLGVTKKYILQNGNLVEKI